VGDRTTLNQLFEAIRSLLAPKYPHLAISSRLSRLPRRRRAPFAGRHFQGPHAAGYEPTHRISEGLAEAMTGM